jgi:hypothetical protein
LSTRSIVKMIIFRGLNYEIDNFEVKKITEYQCYNEIIDLRHWFLKI